MQILATLAAVSILLAPQAAKEPPAKIPETIFVAEKPADAKCVAEVKRAAKKGDTVVVQAKIGGRAEPFVKNRAVFLVADRCIRSCDEIPGDTCTKPWDYCCEPAESKKANMMTVQFVGADGKPLKVGAQGTKGLEPLALIVVEGKVAEADDKGTFIVNATKVHIEKPAKDARVKDDAAPNAKGTAAK
ncbi:MAG: hypothetical protein ACO3QC_10600 [Phycisphaerales bacterium]